MQLSLLVFLLGIFACHIVSAAFKEEDGVIVLDDSNFDEAMTKYDQILVEFYAPWYANSTMFSWNPIPICLCFY